MKWRRAVAACGILMGCLGAQASTLATYELNLTGVRAFGAGPFGSVTLQQSSSDVVDVRVSLRSDLDFVNTGGPHSVFSFNALNVDPEDVLNIRLGGSDATGLGFTVQRNGQNVPFGRNFSLMIDCTDSRACRNGGPGASADPLTFSIRDALLTDFGFTTDGTSAFFAADVICRSGDCAGVTGSIGADVEVTTVSLPGSLALTSLGLIGLGCLRRRGAQAVI